MHLFYNVRTLITLYQCQWKQHLLWFIFPNPLIFSLFLYYNFFKFCILCHCCYMCFGVYIYLSVFLFCLRPGLRSTVTGYLPSVILAGCIYVVPFAMIGMAKLAGYVSRSRKDIKACNMVFYFLVGNVFFLSLLSGSLLDQIGKSFSQPKDFPSHLASAVSAQVRCSNFYLFQLLVLIFWCLQFIESM